MRNRSASGRREVKQGNFLAAWIERENGGDAPRQHHAPAEMPFGGRSCSIRGPQQHYSSVEHPGVIPLAAGPRASFIQFYSTLNYGPGLRNCFNGQKYPCLARDSSTAFIFSKKVPPPNTVRMALIRCSDVRDFETNPLHPMSMA